MRATVGVYSEGSRTKPAWDKMLSVLADKEWHRWTDVVQEMLTVSDILPKSASNRIHDAVTLGLVRRVGQHPDRIVKLV